MAAINCSELRVLGGFLMRKGSGSYVLGLKLSKPLAREKLRMTHVITIFKIAQNIFIKILKHQF